MKKILPVLTLIVILFTTAVSSSHAQNLVLNPSFETYTACPMGPSEFDLAVNWRNPWVISTTDTCSTPDLYNSCCPLGGLGMGTPANLLGFQYPHTGNGYAGLITMDVFGMFCNPIFSTGWKEYIEGQFTSPLVAGQQYCVSFYVSVPDNVSYAAKNIGVYLSNTLVSVDCSVAGGGPSHLPYTPQLQYTGGFITDTVGWTLLEWTYTAAGGEQYIVIGNFNTDANTQYQCNNPNAINPQAYYYIDDVSVVLGACTTCPPLTVTALQVIDANCYGAATGGFVVTTTGGTGPYDYYLSSGGTIIDSAINITGNHSFIALAAGMYTVSVLDANDCPGSLVVTINQPPPVYPQIMGDTVLCAGSTTILNAGLYSSYLWSTGAATQTISVSVPGYYGVTVSDNNGCSGATTVHVSEVTSYDATILSIGPYCVYEDTVYLNAMNSGGIWTGPGIINQALGIFSPSDAGLGQHQIMYTITGICGDADTATIFVDSTLDATINSYGPICSNIPAFNLGTASPGGNWSGQGIVNSTNGTFNPLIAGVGYHLITYNISGLCGNSDTALLHIIPAPTIQTSASPESCTGANDGFAFAYVSGGTQPYTYFWNTNDTDDSISGLAPGAYSVTVTDAQGCIVASTAAAGASDIPCDYLPPVIYVPTIFSPNDDGKNDLLYVRGEGIASLEFVVYNRWGQKVFETTDQKKGWDGTLNGKQVDQAVFVWYLKAIMVTDEKIQKKGTVSLVR